MVELVLIQEIIFYGKQLNKTIKLMKITKLGHCCLLIEENNVKILTDPGNFTIDSQEKINNIDLVLITHEHADHIHVPSLKKIIENNPSTKIITNGSVGKLIEKENLKFDIVKDKEIRDFKGIILEAIEGKHETIFEEFGQVQNTGFFINKKLFYPGDSYIVPENNVDILALPVAGPWCKVNDFMVYALKVKPKIAFPVHDGMLSTFGGNHNIPLNFLPKNGIEFIILEIGKETEF